MNYFPQVDNHPLPYTTSMTNRFYRPLYETRVKQRLMTGASADAMMQLKNNNQLTV